MKRAWSRVVVEEGNLKSQISALRKVLGQDRNSELLPADRSTILAGSGRGHSDDAGRTVQSRAFSSRWPDVQLARPVGAMALHRHGDLKWD